MRWKKHSPEEIVSKLSGVRGAVRSGQAMSAAIREHGISEATYFRWRALYGDIDVKQLTHIKQLEIENARLRRALIEIGSELSFS